MDFLPTIAENIVKEEEPRGEGPHGRGTVKLEKVKIRRIIGPTRSGAAVLLGNDKKTFMVFVGLY